jgi:phage recombination protein Bet
MTKALAEVERRTPETVSELVNTQKSSSSIEWNNDQIAIIKSQIAKGCSDGELALFGQVCQKTGLDPFSRQIYAIKRGTNMTIQVSIDGFRTIAARSGLYGGSQTYWCGMDGVWKDVWLGSEPPAAAKTEVWRIGSTEPFTSVARFDSYAQKYNGKLSDMWAKMSDVMIAKCSESSALRKAFPAELSGLYTSEEMAQADGNKSAQYRDKMTRLFTELDWNKTQRQEWGSSIHKGKSSAQWNEDEWQIAIHDLQVRAEESAEIMDVTPTQSAIDFQDEAGDR